MLGIPAAAFALGFSRAPGWSLALPSLLCLALGIHSKLTEPENYDMPGFGLQIFGFLAVVAGFCALIGMAARKR